MKAEFISHAEKIGTDYHVFISKPETIGHSEPWIPAIVLDGDGMFSDFAKEARALEHSDGLAILAVGIGYGAGFGSPKNKRGRDYTPDPGVEEPESGGAEVFLQYICEVLWPELSDRYPLREDIRLLAGHSLGGLFTLHALFREFPFFNHFLAGAPSIWWNESSFMQRLKALQNMSCRLPARLFLGIGEEDSVSMKHDFDVLESALREKPFDGLKVFSQKFPGYTHYNILPALFRAGLRCLLCH